MPREWDRAPQGGNEKAAVNATYLTFSQAAHRLDICRGIWLRAEGAAPWSAPRSLSAASEP
jgi:hypothetical protein